MMTSEEHVRALRQFGYSMREAELLCLAALHSGYFLRRHYRAFLWTIPGRVDDVLITKIMDLARGRILSLG
jgi:hypothetical protein